MAKMLKLECKGGNGGSGASSVCMGGAFVCLWARKIVQPEVRNSKEMMTAAFETARPNALSVVFVDKIQAIFMEQGWERERSGGQHVTFVHK